MTVEKGYTNFTKIWGQLKILSAKRVILRRFYTKGPKIISVMEHLVTRNLCSSAVQDQLNGASRTRAHWHRAENVRCHGWNCFIQFLRATSATMTMVFRGLPQSLETNITTYAKLAHYRRIFESFPISFLSLTVQPLSVPYTAATCTTDICWQYRQSVSVCACVFI